MIALVHRGRDRAGRAVQSQLHVCSSPARRHSSREKRVSSSVSFLGEETGLQVRRAALSKSDDITSHPHAPGRYTSSPSTLSTSSCRDQISNSTGELLLGAGAL